MEAEAAVLPDGSNTTNKQIGLAEEPSQENDQKVPEIRLQGDEGTDECDPEDQKDKHMRTSQRDKRSIKEDFSQFKADVLKVFREKDSSSQTENKPSTSTLDLLKEDFREFKEDMTSVFSSSKETKSTDPKISQSAEKVTNRLSFLNFKDDLSNVFRIGPSKERDNKEDHTSKTKAERTDEPFLQSLFRKDQKPSQKAENSQEVKRTFLETSEEQMDAGFRGNLSEQIEDMVNTQKTNSSVKDKMNEEEDSEVEMTVSDETMTSLSETQQTEGTLPTSQAGDKRINEEEEQEQVGQREGQEQEQEQQEQQEQEQGQGQEDNPSETLPWETLSSGINLFGLRDSSKDDMRGQPGGDLWSVKNFACYLTFDPNTANSELHLTDCNRKATRVWSDHLSSDHPDRFMHCPQVLCREGLLDSVYWEVVWSGGADIGVTYNSISRQGDTASCLLGHNECSWSLECSEGSYTPCHRNKRFRSSSPRPFTHRVGVYLNWSAGSLSFYCVSQDTMVHLHTFNSTFTQPLYPGFWVWDYDSSVLLCQVQLDWERLLQ